MAREWKPGDVAITRPAGRALVIERRSDGALCWMFGDDSMLEIEQGDDARPLVVIDPEDREQVERLANAYVKQWVGPHTLAIAETVNQMQGALREFANPTPPIEEPTARFAVVLDKGGDEWCHVGEGVWRSLTSTGQFMVEKHWHDNSTPLAGNVVRVLSEGVSA